MAGTSIDPSFQFFAVTPANDVPLKYTDSRGNINNVVTRGIYIGGNGNLTVKNDAGVAVTFTALAAGVVHPIACSIVMSTNTTATLIVALA